MRRGREFILALAILAIAPVAFVAAKEAPAPEPVAKYLGIIKDRHNTTFNWWKHRRQAIRQLVDLSKTGSIHPSVVELFNQMVSPDAEPKVYELEPFNRTQMVVYLKNAADPETLGTLLEVVKRDTNKHARFFAVQGIRSIFEKEDSKAESIKNHYAKAVIETLAAQTKQNPSIRFHSFKVIEKALLEVRDPQVLESLLPLMGSEFDNFGDSAKVAQWVGRLAPKLEFSKTLEKEEGAPTSESLVSRIFKSLRSMLSQQDRPGLTAYRETFLKTLSNMSRAVYDTNTGLQSKQKLNISMKPALDKVADDFKLLISVREINSSQIALKKQGAASVELKLSEIHKAVSKERMPEICLDVVGQGLQTMQAQCVPFVQLENISLIRLQNPVSGQNFEVQLQVQQES